MRLRRLSFTLFCCLLSLKSASAQKAQITTLAAMRGQSRPLLIFAPRPEDAQLRIQLRILDEHATEAHDRQLVPVSVLYEAPAPTAVQFTGAEAATLRLRFHIAPTDFAVILIGKDGGPKLRSSKTLSMQKLNETIDSMPMRQKEIHATGPAR